MLLVEGAAIATAGGHSHPSGYAQESGISLIWGGPLFRPGLPCYFLVLIQIATRFVEEDAPHQTEARQPCEIWG